MAVEKKPSSNPERGKVRSAEELETYGVWVKSGPQDVAGDMAAPPNFGDAAAPFDAGFDMGYDPETDPDDAVFDGFDENGFAGHFENADFESAGFERAEFEESGFESDGDEAFDAVASNDEEASRTQLLLKIADELSSIRSDIDVLKKEFAEIRSESGRAEGEAEKTDASEGETWGGGGFFDDGDDDGKIALTDNEMSNILASSSLSGDSGGASFGDSLRDEDEAALKEIARRNEAAAEENGADLDGGADDAERSETDHVFDADLAFPSEEIGEDKLGVGDDDIFGAFADDLPSGDALDDIDELGDLRQGVDPLTPAPDDSDYLEGDPFAATGGVGSLDDANGEPFEVEPSFDGLSSLDGEFDAPDDGPTGADEFSPAAETGLDDDESALDALTLEEEGDEEDDAPFFPADDDEPTFDGVLSLEDDESTLDGETALEDEELPLAGEISLDDGELTLEEEASLEDDPPFGGEISLDDELSFSGEITLDDEDLVMDGETEAIAAPAEDDEVSLPDWLLPESEIVTEVEVAMNAARQNDDKGDASADDEALEAEELSEEDPLDDDAPMFEDISLEMDEMDEMEALEAAEEDSSLVRDIPEGFKADAEEALSADDDLEEIADEEEIDGKPEGAKTGADAELGIPRDLKNELKNVLAYMDQLLESLPEEKIEEFAKSEHFDTYKKLFKELGLV